MNAAPGRQTSRDFVVSAIRAEILSGALVPGERLVVPDIAERYGVSQTPAREALQVLQSEGLVVNHAYRGGRVAELDSDECQEIYLQREPLERLAAFEGTRGITDGGVAEMRAILDSMAEAARAGAIDAFIAADREFHSIHFQASGRPRLWERIRNLRYSGERYTRLSYERLPHELEDAVPRHEELLKHIEARDAEAAAQWTSETLLRVPERTRRLLVGEPPSSDIV